MAAALELSTTRPPHRRSERIYQLPRLQSSAAFTIFSDLSRLAAVVTPIFMLLGQQVATSLFGVGALRLL
jgi:hypothetical protein